MRTRITLAAVVGSILVALVATGPSGAEPTPDGLRLLPVAQQLGSTPQGLAAEGQRLEAMADMYRRLRGAPAASFYTPEALQAAGMRWQALAASYQQRDTTGVGSGTNGFNWGDAGIGAAGGIVVGLLAAGSLVAARRVRRAKLAV